MDTMGPLEQFVGLWISHLPESKYVTLEIRPTVMKKGLYSVAKLFNESQDVTYQADSLWMYNSTTHEYNVYEINSRGEHLIHHGNFIPNGKFHLRRETPGIPGKAQHETLINLEGEDLFICKEISYDESGKKETCYTFTKET